MLLLLLSHTAVLLIVVAQHNLTPFGTATQSSTYRGGIAQNAIKPPVSNMFSYGNCSHTGKTKTPAWWMFQFSIGIAYITDITIYYRESWSKRMDGFKLYVTNTSAIPPDGYLCYEDPDPGLPNITQTIPCNKLGRYVIYYDTTEEDSDGPIIELCYVAIIGCRKGFWGSNCEKVCSEYCTERHCYPGNGSCIFGCNTDYCLNNNCNKFTGICTDGCKERRTGDFCNKFSINTAETDDDEVTTRIGIFIGIFMGGVLLGILMTVFVCFVIRRKRQLPQKQSKDNALKKTQSQDPQHYDDVRMESVSTYQDLRMETGANEYDQISTAYENH
ncbi:Hypothetical predicted protein [Mytilus galloprovincialis]|uniref:Fucolectin tachylectin-4 pentraxin-1 domain-containing protein n=1 Tax=Mytilus galloprovincialis TaxID=29158 RepID=A0A8B6BLS1_MYTGA|nr:Hypothetical predicted protein [Mytilus galloprovincialis]